VGRGSDASQAQEQFQKLKSDQEEREIQMLRDNFLQSLNVAQSDQ
jgi:hypothetical protein